MKRPNSYLFSKILLLFTLFSIGCEKDGSNIEKGRDEITKEVKTLLDGEILFSKNNSVFKTSAKSGGSGVLIRTEAYTLVRQKWSLDGSKFAYIKITPLKNECYLVICTNTGVLLN